jgi:hypothetical protein
MRIPVALGALNCLKGALNRYLCTVVAVLLEVVQRSSRPATSRVRCGSGDTQFLLLFRDCHGSVTSPNRDLNEGRSKID